MLGSSAPCARGLGQEIMTMATDAPPVRPPTRGREKFASSSSFTLHLRCSHPMTRVFHQTEIAISRPGMSM